MSNHQSVLLNPLVAIIIFGSSLPTARSHSGPDGHSVGSKFSIFGVTAANCQLKDCRLKTESCIFAAMIAYLKGDFVKKTPASVQVEVNGVGYEVQISLNTYTQIQKLDKGTLQTLLIVREDAHILYGFFDASEKEMFQQLTAVSGIGASTARVMLSYMKPAELARAIVNSDIRTLEGIKGIGKKTAERIVLELKDKLAKHTPEINISPMKNNTLQQDALNALTALGINRTAAEQALQKTLNTDPDLPVEELIKKTLRIL